MTDPRYPIGKFEASTNFNAEERTAAIEVIKNFPQQLQNILTEVSEVDWERTYRPGSWNITHLVHHCADSNMNCFIRFKLALTETNPSIKPYDENAWVRQEDYSRELVQASLEISRGVHARWSNLMKSMTEEEWTRAFFHPEQQKTIKLSEALAYYSWHCRHHLKHIEIALKG